MTWFWRRRRREAELDEEIQGHLAMAARDHEARGESPDEAAYAARREFGNATLVKEVTRSMWGGVWLDDLLRDLRYAWRGLRHSPGYALIVTLTLAIGIGANAAVISVIDRAFFRKLPVPHPERVVVISSGDVRDRARRSGIESSSFPDYRDLQTRIAGLDGLTAYAMAGLKLGDELAGTEAWSALVAANYFSVLGVRAARGRFIAPDEDQPPGAHPVVVISDAMWKSRFARDEHIVGRQLTVGTVRFTIIGVAPPGFTGVQAEGRTDLWLPYTMQSQAMGSDYLYGNRDARLAFIVGRLAPSGTLAQVQMSLDRAASDLRATYPDLDGSLRLYVRRHDRLVPIEQAPFALVSFLLIWAMVVLLHLVACSNVTSLILARAAAKRQELGIRLCLGASPRRIVMQSLTEPGLLALLGATALPDRCPCCSCRRQLPSGACAELTFDINLIPATQRPKRKKSKRKLMAAAVLIALVAAVSSYTATRNMAMKERLTVLTEEVNGLRKQVGRHRGQRHIVGGGGRI